MYRVAVSAGHYAEKQGAVFEGVTEFDETVPWQFELIAALIDMSAKRGVLAQPFHIDEGTLTEKVKQINGLNCDLAVEIHFNAGGTATTKGCETLFYPGSAAGEAAAVRIQTPLAIAMETKSRGCKPGWYRMDRPGVVDFYGDEDGDEMPDYFLRATNCTALILEPEFLQQIESIREHRAAGIFQISKAIIGLAQDAQKHGEEDQDGAQEEGTD